MAMKKTPLIKNVLHILLVSPKMSKNEDGASARVDQQRKSRRG